MTSFDPRKSLQNSSEPPPPLLPEADNSFPDEAVCRLLAAVLTRLRTVPEQGGEQ